VTASARLFANSGLNQSSSFTAAKVVYETPGVLWIPNSMLPAGFDARRVAILREGRVLTALAVTADGVLVYVPGYSDNYTDKDTLLLRGPGAPTAAGTVTRES